MKTILALQGDRNTGKTATFLIFHSILLKKPNGYLQVHGEYQVDNQGDIIDIFEKAGRRIGLASSGDAPSILAQNILYMHRKKCDIVITACHTQRYVLGRRIINEIEKFPNYVKLYKLKGIASYHVAPESSLNDPYNISDANTLYKILEQFIK